MDAVSLSHVTNSVPGNALEAANIQAILQTEEAT